METIELQHFLITAILNTKDVSFLKELKNLFENKIIDNQYILTEQEKKMLLERKNNIHKTIDNDEVFNQLKY